MPRDWYKRRTPTQERKPTAVIISNFKKEQNFICEMSVTYDDGSTQELKARVLQNHVTKHWAVDGMHVAAKLIEED